MAAIPETMASVRRLSSPRPLSCAVQPAGRPAVAAGARPRLQLVVGGAEPGPPGHGAVRSSLGRVAPSVGTRRTASRSSQLLAALLTLAGLGGLWLGAGALRSADGAPAPIRLAGTTPVAGGYRYVVQPGDSLWSIAVRVEPDGDPRPLVDELEAQLHGATPQPGNVLVLP